MESMKEPKFCPLVKCDCKEGRCAWYVSGPNECAVNWIAQTLDCMEDKEKYED